MSVFSKLKMSKKAAKEHKEKVKEQEAEPVKVSYKHTPTHAAFDALSGSPSSWSHGDRPKIQEQHKRRSQLAISRTGSSLSTTMSYMNASTNLQAPQLPRNSSYNSYQPTWNDRGDNSNFMTERSEQAAKRRKPSRGHSYHDSGLGTSVGPSPLASNMQSEEVSPAISSGNSASSEHSSDNLEMPRKPGNPHRNSYRHAPQPNVYADQNIFDQLHTSTTRKLGEAPLYDSPPVTMKAPMAVSTIEAPTKKKNRWSLLGKRNAISAM